MGERKGGEGRKVETVLPSIPVYAPDTTTNNIDVNVDRTTSVVVRVCYV